MKNEIKTTPIDPYIIERHQRTSLELLYDDETIFSIANGIIGTRGHFAEGYGAGNDYPQTFLNGFYNVYSFTYEENSIHFPQLGQTIVNLPDGSPILIKVKGQYLQMANANLVKLQRNYDLKQGLTSRFAQYKTLDGYLFDIVEEKIISPYDQTLIITKFKVSSSNYEGPITIESLLRMPRIKKGNGLDPRLAKGMINLILNRLDVINNECILEATTTKTNKDITCKVKHDLDFQYVIENDYICAHQVHEIRENQPFVVTKYVKYETEDFGKTKTMYQTFDAYLAKKSHEMNEFWNHHQIVLSDLIKNQRINYHVYQLASSGGVDPKLQIPAKGLSGEGYEGHYFWDTEIYMIPYFILTDPKKAKNLLMYRYSKLAEAKQEAQKLGVSRGVKIPWRTINGFETSPYFLAGSAQIHINSDLAYAIMQYYYATQDEQFMINYGFELLLETALFMLDYGTFIDDTFHINQVTGPDEYTVLVNNNYYTNSMAKKHFEAVAHYWLTHHERIRPVLNKIGVDKKDLEILLKAAKHIVLTVDPKQKLIEQHQGFKNLKSLDENTFNQLKKPVLLNYHPLFVYRHQILKQADAVLAMVLLNESDQQTYEHTYEYYLKRTTHDSSLSKCMYGIAAYHLNKDEADQYFADALALDLENRHYHTKHGLHTANLGGTYLMLAYGIFGLRLENILCIKPAKTNIEYVSMVIQYQGRKLTLTIENNTFILKTDQKIKVNIDNQIIDIENEFRSSIKLA
jgi:alpha,alpha-trehalose phosphorylase